MTTPGCIRIDLPGENWADLYLPEELLVKRRKLIQAHYAAVVDAATGGNLDRIDEIRETPGTMAAMTANAMLDLNTIALRAFLVAWSFDLPIPWDDPDSLEELRAHDVDKLEREAMKLVPHAWVSLEPTPDPTRPTEPSGTSVDS